MKKIAIYLLFLSAFCCLIPQSIFASSEIGIKLKISQEHQALGTTCYYPDCLALNIPIAFDIYASEIIYVYRSQTNILYNKSDPVNGKVELTAGGLTQEKELNNGQAVFYAPWATSLGPYNFIIRVKRNDQIKFHTILENIILIRNCTDMDTELCGEEHFYDSHPFRLCNQVKFADVYTCQTCQNNDGIWTAVGCIPTDPMQMVKVLLRIGLLIGGGVALLIILAGSFILSTSSGDPKKTSEAKEMISSALIGLVFIIFSVSILQLIGVQILRIPGFGQ